MGATTQAAPPKHRPDRARARGYRNRPRLAACVPVSPTPLYGWVLEGLPPTYLAALLLKVRLERIAVGVLNPQTGRPYSSAFDVREFRTLLVEQALLCRLAVGGRHGGTIVTTSFQLYKTLAEAHPSWRLPADENKARDLLATRIRQRLFMLDACGLLAYWQDGHTDEHDVQWIGRRTILQLRELPPLTDEELAAGAAVVRARQRAYGASLNTDSTIAVRNAFVASRPLTRSEIQRRGLIHTKAAKAARTARDTELQETPAVVGNSEDIAHPIRDSAFAENYSSTDTSTPKPSGFTDARARKRAHESFDALPALDPPVPFGPGTTKAAGEGGCARKRVEHRSATGPESAQQARAGEPNGLDDPRAAENGLSPYMLRLVRWQLGPKQTPIPHPGYPSPADRDDPGWLRDRAAYRAVLREHPEQSRDLIRHRQRVGELRELAERVAAAPIERNTSWTELAYCWAVIRHGEFAYGEERRGCLEQAGILTRKDRDTLDKAIALYERHAQHRLDGWPATGAQALWYIGQLAHDGLLPAFRATFKAPACRWLADGIERLRQEARDMAAAGKLSNPERANRQRRRAIRRTVERTRSSTSKLRFEYRYRPTEAQSLADTLLNARGEIPDVYEVKRDHALLSPDPTDPYQQRRGPSLPAHLDGAATRRLRKAIARHPAGTDDLEALPRWQQHPYTPRRVTITISDGTPWAYSYTTWRAEPDVDRDRLELARYLGDGSLPQVLAYSNQVVDHMLRQYRQRTAEAQRATSPYRFTYGPRGGALKPPSC